MIIVRSPLRITLGGGGTDLPSYYRGHEGFLVAAAIDRYVYVTVTRPFSPGVYLKYSSLEHVERVDQVRHPIIRAALELQELATPQIEITTLADIPAGTGLGSSGSFTTALLRARAYRRRLRSIRRSFRLRLPVMWKSISLASPSGSRTNTSQPMGGSLASPSTRTNA
jgi:D-glycero-alpha-D-manno-heptose-7-phosphate kinase